ncbi:hypothetical protein [Kitasatospora sp. CB02891]|uniref:hypothetical protein n=1 Tax=Kitasatospora sp. CB02891 TaxID=2020329 RepID=UPI0012FD138A|nr:hypothetical protein [Kitasatospora sp. CB02891]
MLGWAALALFTAAFAIFEAVAHGWWTALAGAALLVVPGLVGRVGPVGPRADRAAHRALPPVVVLIAYSLSPLEQPWIFTAALGRLTAVAISSCASAGRRRRCSTTG